MAELKDLIPAGYDNDSNSGDSWFVLSSASEEEDEDADSAIEKPNLVQSEKEESEKKEDVPEPVKPEPQQLENSHGDASEGKENGPLDEILRVEQSENIQEDTVEKTEHNHIDKLEVAEISQKETAETMENGTLDEIPRVEQLENIQKCTVEIVSDEKSEIPMELEKEQEKPELSEEKKQEKQVDKEIKNLENKVDEDKKKSPDYKDTIRKQSTRLEEESVIAETEKPIMAKQRKKAKPLVTEEGSHSEIALEVHALRETLIQLSLNLSNIEEEKYSSIASEVQALRETVTQLNNDLSNRVSQIETRTEQVHTLLCRFIMTRCGSYKEPPTRVITAAKEHGPEMSNAAVQTEISDLSDLTDQNYLPNKTQNEEILAATDKSLHVSKTDDERKSHVERKALLPTPDLPSKQSKALLATPEFPPKQQPDSYRSKRPRLDNETSKISKGSSRKNGIESFHQSRQSHDSNQELAELAYCYSSENSKHRRRKRSSHSRQTDSDRKHPYSKGMLEDQDTELDRASSGFPDELDMDKVIDEWAQDED